jgi:hypothetical protein
VSTRSDSTESKANEKNKALSYFFGLFKILHQKFIGTMPSIPLAIEGNEQIRAIDLIETQVNDKGVCRVLFRDT